MHGAVSVTVELVVSDLCLFYVTLQEDLDMDLQAVGSVDQKGEEQPTGRTRKAALAHLILRQSKVMESIRTTRTVQFLFATAQLCHMDTALAERVWLDIFPRLWSILTEKQQAVSNVPHMR